MYAKYLEKHVRPFVGRQEAGAVDEEVLDSLYAELRRCRIHCTSKRGLVDHRTPRPHECDERCRPHSCNGLSSTTIRHIHFVLRGAYEKGVRWRRELTFYRCAGPATTPLTELIRVAGARWSIEECFQAAKNEARLDHYQVRSYRAWHAHITLAMLAAAYLAVARATAHDREAEKGDLQPAAHG